MHKAYAILFFFASWSGIAQGSDRRVAIFSLNIQWYGLGGSMEGSPEQEDRDSDLATLVGDAFDTHDVGVFEEIVHVDRFIARIVPRDVECQSYDHQNAKHQHVVVCVRRPLEFKPLKTASHFTWDDVAVGQTRPAVVGRICDRSGKTITHLIAVHLKSSPEFSNVRKQQAKILASHIRNEIANSAQPVVVTGDFNTFGNDDEVIRTELSRSGMDFFELRSAAKNTFATRKYQNKFDRIFFSAGLSPASLTLVSGPCNTLESRGEAEESIIKSLFGDLDEWNRKISDHCLIHASFVKNSNGH
ncbi:MAG: hypothetical protein RIQ81_280 [Pseudomonadota bacterium]